MRRYQLHYRDGRVESREAFSYTEDDSRIYFHRSHDKSDRDSWEERTLLLMIAEDQAKTPPAPEPFGSGSTSA